jgi:transposase
MKNKYVEHTHLSEKIFRKILRLFCADLSATQIAKITGVSRNAINRLLAALRQRITALAETESDFTAGEIEIDESYFGPRRVRGKRGRGAGKKKIVFGVKKRGGRVFTQVVKNCSARVLVPIIKRVAPPESTIFTDEWKSYDGLVGEGYKHHRVKHCDDVFANGKAHVNGIENFWGIAKTRLAKFRGIRGDKFYGHLKETEFRFNHRKDNLYKLLLKSCRDKPLKVS